VSRACHAEKLAVFSFFKVYAIGFQVFYTVAGFFRKCLSKRTIAESITPSNDIFEEGFRAIVIPERGRIIGFCNRRCPRFSDGIF
jgi:hypothetical protein